MTLSVDAMTEVDRLSRDRRRDREPSDSNSPDLEAVGHSSPKKRKRSRKAHSDKKFECKHEGCGKSYSRAEHLYRHQLNHTPKQIYWCNYPECNRSFVRQDLCIRHRDRHTTHGSQLQRRDNFAHAASTLAAVRPPPRDVAIAGSSTAAIASPPEGLVSPAPSTTRHPPALQINPATNGVHQRSATITPLHTNLSSLPMAVDTYQPLTPQTGYGSSDGGIKQSDTASNYTLSPPKTQAGPAYGAANGTASYGPGETSNYHAGPFSPTELGRNPSAHTIATTAAYPTSVGIAPISTAYSVPAQSLSMSALTQAGRLTPTLTQTTTAPFTSATGLNPLTAGPAVGDSGPDCITPPTYPVFGGETYNRSPFAMADDFAAWLFHDPSSASPVGNPAVSGMLAGFPDASPFQSTYYTNDTMYSNYFTNVVPQHPMSVTSILDPGPPETIMSEEKRQDLLHLITTQFHETSHAAVNKRKEALMDGDVDADSHVLSLRMMQWYIGSYWVHFHTQLPILHKPTFVADKTPNLLLLAILAIGASTLDKAHGQATTEAAANLANFFAWHLRWEIFMDTDFRPPAKLWVFQALLLLEIYEKMYSTRALHERAHIHHDTTLTLMRRGSSLIGRSAFDSPASVRDDRQGRSTTSGPEYGVGDESWAHWIKTEATRRVAFAAFVLDSIHATMFGHSAKMVAHEMRLPLPCDEALWSATSAAEVARMQTSLQSNGVKPTMFLDGLKKTLIGQQKVRTNAFGRTILMAGLLSVSWHMNQRDLQVSSLGVVQALGGRDKWRSALLRAYDNWKRDFDEALVESGPRPYNLFRQQYPVDEDDNIFESRTVLHHLAHMASHVDIVDCQIFAGAGRLLGRSITPKDYSTAREKMIERWATKASARDATFYALKFLAQVLLPDDGPSGQGGGGQWLTDGPGYCAREDFLLNRPWVLYFAALVVWSYGYALDGPIKSAPVLATVAEQHRDMEEFLERVGGVKEPNDLEAVTGRNCCLGLLMTLRNSFVNTRWELLHEAVNLLDNCIQKLRTPLAEKTM